MSPHHFASLILQSRRSSSLPISISQSPFMSHLHSSRSDRSIRLNSTLSVRIEELNAQISALHVENLRLRASEIALGSQLKKEREKSQRIIADAESAVSPHFHLLSESQFSQMLYDALHFFCLVHFHTSASHRPRIFTLPLVILAPILTMVLSELFRFACHF